MKKKIWSRLLSLLLVAQMLVSSAYGVALAAPSEEDTSIPTQVADNAPYQQFRISHGYRTHRAGKPTDPEPEHSVNTHEIAVEAASFTAKTDKGGTWHKGVDGYWLKDIALNGAAADLAAVEASLGRLPDRTFAGWYVYGAEINADFGSDERRWQVEPTNYVATENDYLLTTESAVDMSAAAGVICPQDEKNGLYGYEWYEFPMIAHWSLSADPSLVSSVDINPLGGESASTEKTALRGVVKKSGTSVVEDAPLELCDQAWNQTPFAGDTLEYYVRVPAHVEELDLALLAAEPFRDTDINLTTSGVRVKLTPAGESKSIDYTLGQTILNDSIRSEKGYYTTRNTEEFPLRSQWSTDGGTHPYLPLTPSGGAGKYYNQVEVIVTAPDGVTEQTYTFYVQRLSEPVLLQNPGNTPLGMIERDDGNVWQLAADAEKTTVEAEKEKAKTLFRAENSLKFDGLLRPNGARNNNGRIYAGTYTANAWGSDDNVDLDENAIVVYQDSGFADPGFAIIDSQGDVASPTDVERGVTLRLVERLTVADLKDTAGKPYYYDGTTLTELPENEGVQYIPVTHADGKDFIDLRGEKVLPGFYRMEYSYKDVLAGKTFTSDPDSFEYGKGDKAPTFCRTLVVLPAPGDIDMDGAVTAADAELLRRALDPKKDDIAFLDFGEKVTDLFAARVCDVDNSGTVDALDVARIQNGYNPVLSDRECDYFYLPLPNDGQAENERKPLEITVPDPNKQGALTFAFLGVNNAAITADPQKLDDISAENAIVKRDDVFWVGVKVSDMEAFAAKADHAICGGITSINLTLAYDSAYVTPALLPVEALGGDENAQWLETLRRYNIGDADNATATTWGNHYIIADGTVTDAAYAMHFSKAILPLESSAKSTIRELTVAIRCKDTSYRRLVDEGGSYLLRVPFKLTTFPFGQDKAQVLDLCLGMGDFALFSRLVPDNMEIPQVAAAWSAQDEIFGGATWNLRSELAYVGGTAREIPLGIDDTPRQDLLNEYGDTVYGSLYTNKRSPSGLNATEINSQLPKGLLYTSDGVITGTPQEVGVFDFQVESGNGTRTVYRIDVKRAPLTLTVTGQTRYYGEPNGELSYTYKKEDIKPVDLPGGLNHKSGFENTGESGQLEKLAGFRAPKLSTLVTQSTSAGIHTISIEPLTADTGLENYYFVYADTTEAEHTYSEERGAAPLEILRRPIHITRINDTAMTPVQVRASDSRTDFKELAAIYQNGVRSDFDAELPGSSYNGRNLTGAAIYADDAVSLSFSAKLTHENAAPPYYNFADAAEYSKTVSAALSDTILANGETENNYILIYPYLKATTANATVTQNPAVKIEMVEMNAPKMGPYKYGEPFFLSGMQVNVTYEDGSTRLTQYVTEESFAEIGVKVTWERGGESVPTADDGQKLTNGQLLDVNVHNNRYLCVSVEGYREGVPARVYAYSKEPFVITQKQIALTVTPVEVYYGEFDAATTKLTYTYNPADLSDEDAAALKAKLSVTVLVGSEEELSKLDGYVAPKLEAKLSQAADAPLMTADAPAGAHVITISNEKDSNGRVLTGCTNYAFVYRNVNSTPLEFDKPGYNIINVRQRPLVVKVLTVSTDVPDSRYFLYDDTMDTLLARTYGTDGLGAEVTAQGRRGADTVADSFLATLPANDYAYVAGDNDRRPLVASLDKSREAIHQRADGTLDEVVLTYSAEYTKDNPAGNPLNGIPYFTLAEGETEAVRPVTIRGLSLPKGVGNNDNYLLVFDTLNDANSRRPKENVGKGTVKLRPLSEITITTPPTRRSDYIYGDELNLTGMALHMAYEAEGDNNPTANAKLIDRTLPYKMLTISGTWTNSFALQGLEMHWITPGTDLTDLDTLTDAQRETLLGPAVDSGNFPTLAESGKKIMVCGRRSAKDALVWDETADNTAFTISKKGLPLTAESRHRYYGEPNGTYSAYYLYGALAKPDQIKLSAQYPNKTFGEKTKLYVTAPGTDGVTNVSGRDLTRPADSEELLFLDSTYTGVKFNTAGHQGANVGGYTIELASAGSGMANYQFTDRGNTSARMSIFRRPLVVDQVPQKPVSTIYFNTPETEFPAYITQTGQGSGSGSATKLYTVLPVIDGNIYASMTDSTYVAAVNGGMEQNLKLSGDAIYGSDVIGINMTAVFPEIGNREPIPGNTHLVDQPITVKKMTLGAGASNYILVYTDEVARAGKAPTRPGATGKLDRRDIKKVEIIENPVMEYTYPQTLNLSALKLRLTFEALEGGESFDTVEEVYYYQYGGVSVNYWADENLPADNGAGVGERPARSGDHLTIAPDHTAEGFVHNGKYLIVTARVHSSMPYVKPALVSDLSTGVPIPLTVNPLDLTYRFTAKNKVYNGDTAAEGQMALENPYVSDGGDFDVIYVTTGADYETPNVENPIFSDYTDLCARLSTQGYRYDSGDTGLTFTFFDENVKYADETHTTAAPVAPALWQSYWDSLNHAPKTSESEGWDTYGDIASLPVRVSGITLAGPDAANYMLDGAVGLTDNADNPDKDTVPYAAIEKAERPIAADIRPQVSVDVHTNAVKLTYTKPISAVQDNNDDYAAELHYEYGLEYQDAESGESLRWGGADVWKDTYYFGGEKEECPPPEGYEPSKPPEPPKENDIIKGQIYGWSEDGNHWYDAADTLFGQRDPLPLDTVFWGVTRMAETHNYKASDPLRSTEDVEGATAAAREASRALSQAILDRVGKGSNKDEDVDPAPIPAAAVKTFAQQLTLISTAQERGLDTKDYRVDTLESVWFTDILDYEKREVLDVVTRNSDPTRYYGYFWDVDHSAELKFEPVVGMSLKDPLTVTIRERQSDNTTVEKDVVVNADNRADLYVNITAGGGAVDARSVSITPGAVAGVLGGQPVQLTAVLSPSYTTNKKVTWASSDPRVAQVSETGLLFFVGQGRAIITVTTKNKKTASIVVTVSDLSGKENNIGVADLVLEEGKVAFDLYYTKPYLKLDSRGNFNPTALMNRAQLVELLAQFYVDIGKEPLAGKGVFSDLTGKEPYAAAAKLLGGQGIITGLPDGTFGATQTATRAEMAVILCRMLGIKPESTKGKPHAFVDAGETDTWAYSYIDALAKAGVFKGTGGGRFNPNGKITKAEAAVLLGRILLSGGVERQNAAQIPGDVPSGHWGYGPILRAVNTVKLPENYKDIIKP